MTDRPTPRVTRRGLLGSAAGTAVGAAVTVPLAVSAARAVAPTAPAVVTSYPFEGPHQQGILTPA